MTVKEYLRDVEIRVFLLDRFSNAFLPANPNAKINDKINPIMAFP